MQRRNPVLARLREQKYILILNWNKEENTITYKDGSGRFVNYASEPKTASIKIHHNLVIVGNKSFSRRYLKTLSHVNKIPKKQAEGNDSCLAPSLQIC